MSEQIYRWKGKIVTKKLYDERVRIQQLGRCNRKKSVLLENVSFIQEQESYSQEDRLGEKKSELTLEEFDNLDGRRIVELKTLGSQLWCVSCKETLSLENIEREVRRGFGSIWTVRCHKCLLLNEVTTGKQYILSSNRKSARFDINSKAVIGALHSGMGWTHLNKLFACMNIPCPDFKTFKKYETEIGTIAEEVSKESCKDATALERKMTIKNIDTIEKSL
ncbi:uncharacterized protein [Venturia canescens]|uniref:uncharacterized protein n=1 Tax=Venturia canescens TaxID=32260 RepID=UPI001C9D1C45|nr:uncharacterized protein LOC122410294 [Venturia canescens]